MGQVLFPLEVTVALSGTLDTFALPDVLRLLASTVKTGRLRVTSSEGSGSVWIDSGSVAHAELVGDPRSETTASEVLFGLLRLVKGSFTFEDDLVAESAGATEPMETALSKAEAMLEEWRTIELVVPSTDVWVGLRNELDGPDVMVDSSRWSGIAAVGSGRRVAEVGQELDMHEVAVCRLVKELIELGLVEIVEEQAPVEEVESVETFEPITVEDNYVDDEFDSGEPNFDEAVSDESSTDEPEPESEVELEDEFDGDPVSESFGDDPALDPLLSAGDPLAEFGLHDEEHSSGGLFSGSTDSGFGSDDEALNPAEMARQLANLSPRAAKAVAEAARATTDAERDAALAAVEAEDETVNRGLLLKFLGSVDS